MLRRPSMCGTVRSTRCGRRSSAVDTTSFSAALHAAPTRDLVSLNPSTALDAPAAVDVRHRACDALRTAFLGMLDPDGTARRPTLESRSTRIVFHARGQRPRVRGVREPGPERRPWWDCLPRDWCERDEYSASRARYRPVTRYPQTPPGRLLAMTSLGRRSGSVYRPGPGTAADSASTVGRGARPNVQTGWTGKRSASTGTGS